MWNILLAELKYNWVRILISVLLMTMPLNIIISLLKIGVINDLPATDGLNMQLLVYVSAAIMFFGMFTTIPVLIRYFIRFRSKSGVSIRSMLPLTPLQFALSHIMPIILISQFLVVLFTISLLSVDIDPKSQTVLNLLTVNGLWLTMIFLTLMWVEYSRMYIWVRNTGIAVLSIGALLMVLAGKFEVEFVGNIFKLFFKSLFSHHSAGAYSLLALIVIVTYIVMFTRRKSFLS
ncbi:MAG: hypothetical protein HN590_13615 [Calditrichaeota bacterium]|nr:hypothetical protein [Calditrichota bacterium]